MLDTGSPKSPFLEIYSKGELKQFIRAEKHKRILLHRWPVHLLVKKFFLDFRGALWEDSTLLTPFEPEFSTHPAIVSLIHFHTLSEPFFFLFFF